MQRIHVPGKQPSVATHPKCLLKSSVSCKEDDDDDDADGTDMIKVKSCLLPPRKTFYFHPIPNTFRVPTGRRCSAFKCTYVF